MPYNLFRICFIFFHYNLHTSAAIIVKPVDILLAIISEKSLEEIQHMSQQLLESSDHALEMKSVSTRLENILQESPSPSEMRKSIFVALFEMCKTDLLRQVESKAHRDDILRSSLKYILQTDDTPAKAKVLNIAGAKLKRKLSDQDCLVWGGLNSRGENNNDVCLVCLHKGNIKSKLNPYLGLQVLYQEYDRIEREPFDNCFSDEYRRTSISPDDRVKANILINAHGEELFKSHTNLEAISASSVLSSKSRGLEKTTSIVLYCRMKGVIPIGEKPFPKTLELGKIVLSTDVREGFFTFGMYAQPQQVYHRPIDHHDVLRMGCSVGRENSFYSGTIGPFVRLGSKELGFITCAHVVGLDKQAVLNKKIVQPAYGDLNASPISCGTVANIEFDPGRPVGVDAALVKVEHRDVAPTEFVWFNPKEVTDAGFDLSKPPCFRRGIVMTQLSFSSTQGKRVIKCGKSTGLKKGSLALDGVMIKVNNDPYHPLYLPEGMTWRGLNGVVMKGQYLVENNRFPFFSAGDSGAGVYIVEDDQTLSLIGLAIGLLNEYTVVTPIEDVLQSLGLQPQDVISEELMDTE